MRISTVKYDPSLGVLPRSHFWSQTMLKAFGRWIDGIRKELRLRRDTAHVMSLDDRLLSDIGLSRGSIERCLRSGAANDNWCPNPPPRSVSSTGPTAERQRWAAQPAPEKRKMPAHMAGIHLA